MKEDELGKGQRSTNLELDVQMKEDGLDKGETFSR